MKIHEYQAKKLLAEAGVAVPKGIVAKNADEAAKAFAELGGPLAVVKSQIHAGGRGKGRFKEHPQQAGVVLVRSAQEAKDNAARMLGSTLVTIQTGEEGKQVSTVFLEQGLDIARELYLGIVVDRDARGPVLMMSTEGGMEIEEVAKKSPEREPSLFAFGHEGALGQDLVKVCNLAETDRSSVQDGRRQPAHCERSSLAERASAMRRTADPELVLL